LPNLGAHRAPYETATSACETDSKSFLGASEVADLEQALGQYILYSDILEETEPERLIYLAISSKVYEDLFQEPIGQLV
jgi:hypothetical protein